MDMSERGWGDWADSCIEPEARGLDVPAVTHVVNYELPLVWALGASWRVAGRADGFWCPNGIPDHAATVGVAKIDAQFIHT